MGPNKKSEVLDTARDRLEACERQVIASQDGADTLLRRDKEILGAQLVHNDSFGSRPIDSISTIQYERHGMDTMMKTMSLALT